MSTSISFAAMSVDSGGPFGTSDPQMRDGMKSNRGIKSLIEAYKTLFRIPENSNHYSEKDYRAAERKFLKYALEKGRIEFEKEHLKE